LAAIGRRAAASRLLIEPDGLDQNRFAKAIAEFSGNAPPKRVSSAKISELILTRKVSSDLLRVRLDLLQHSVGRIF